MLPGVAFSNSLMTSFPFNSGAKRFSLVAIVSEGKLTRTFIILVDYTIMANPIKVLIDPVFYLTICKDFRRLRKMSQDYRRCQKTTEDFQEEIRNFRLHICRYIHMGKKYVFAVFIFEFFRREILVIDAN